LSSEDSWTFSIPTGTAAQGNVQVIAEPGTQANVPAPPKVLQPPGQKRLPEVDHEMKAQQLCAATCDIAVAAKVSIYLPSKRIRSDQNNPKIRCSELPAKSRICQQSAIVCDHALAHQPGKKSASAHRKIGPRQNGDSLVPEGEGAPAFELGPQSGAETG